MFYIDAGERLTTIAKELGSWENKLFPIKKNRRKLKLFFSIKFNNKDVLVSIIIITVQLQLFRLLYCFLNRLLSNV